MKKIRNRVIIVLVVAVVAVAGYWLLNNYSFYDYAHLSPHTDYGQGVEFTALSGVEELDGMQPVAENDTLTLYIDPVTTCVAVLDKRNGERWYSCPPEYTGDAVANTYEKEVMQSLAGFRYYDAQRRRYNKWSFTDAAANGQFTLESIPNGVRVKYDVGDLSLGIDACPRYLTQERFQARVLDQLEDASDVKFIQRMYVASRTKEGFMELLGGVRTHAVNSKKTIGIFEKLNYTLEELEADNALAGYEFEISLDVFTFQLEFTLKNDTLAVNLPLSEFSSSSGDNKLFYFDMMKYFGAGGTDEEGYMLVPSGSGALIDFNNGKINEETYIGNVYGLDPLMNWIKPQLVNPVRLPVLGIKKDNAAMLAYIENGAALAIVNADVAGKINSYNTAWFSFLLRDYTMMTMAAGSETDMTVVQPYAYESDITINYCFLAGDDADYTGMGLAYQQALADRGALTPLTEEKNMPFYLDIVGGVDKTKFALGVPYYGIVPMTTYKQAGEILDKLNTEDVHAVQMRWLGWFNRGINHNVAKNIDWIGAIGSKNDMRALNDKLTADGGGLYPTVNFQAISYYSKNINKSYEIARDPAGYIGFLSSFNREFLRTMGGRFRSDWFLLVSPGILPFHVDRFIPAYNKLSVDTLSLGDLGDVLTESIYRKDYVDRENSRLIVSEQLGRLDDAYKRIMVSGGNDYALGTADHLVDIPVEMDRFYILDHEVPFYEIVVHGYIDYTGTAVNTRETQDAEQSFLYMLATGAAPHYLWTWQPTRDMEFTPYERYYSTQYEEWFDAAVEQYRLYNDIYKNLRTQRITGHEILYESTARATAVTVTEYGDGTKIYVNTTYQPYTAGAVTVPARGYAVEGGAR